MKIMPNTIPPPGFNGGGLLVIHALQNGILSVPGTDGEDRLLEGFPFELFRGVLEHVQLHGSGILADAAGDIDQTDGKLGINDPSVQGVNRRDNVSGQIGHPGEFGRATGPRSALMPRIDDDRETQSVTSPFAAMSRHS